MSNTTYKFRDVNTFLHSIYILFTSPRDMNVIFASTECKIVDVNLAFHPFR